MNDPLFLLRFIQQHPTFRQAEIESCAAVNGYEVPQSFQYVEYSHESPFAILKLDEGVDPQALVKRSILSQAIFELWGEGNSYEELHRDVRTRTQSQWDKYKTCSFCFKVDTFNHKRTQEEQTALVESFSYLAFEGPIQMRNADELFVIHEYWTPFPASKLKRLYLGRYLGKGSRELLALYDLKKRSYVGNTSFEAELSLVTANMALARPGTLIYDPFCGTGSFLYTCSHFGAMTLGSDIDGRNIRGKEGKSVNSNLAQYNLTPFFLDGLTLDTTQNPLRKEVLFDAIVSPYGVRAGAKRLGSKKDMKTPILRSDGRLAHTLPDFVYPTVLYELRDVIGDLMSLAAQHLKLGGRLVFWLPLIGEVPYEERIPKHPLLKLISNCEQEFNQWTRSLLTYVRVDSPEVELGLQESRKDVKEKRRPEFRDMYFHKDLRFWSKDTPE